jgi:hypothetical protein
MMPRKALHNFPIINASNIPDNVNRTETIRLNYATAQRNGQINKSQPRNKSCHVFHELFRIFS